MAKDRGKKGKQDGTPARKVTFVTHTGVTSDYYAGSGVEKMKPGQKIWVKPGRR